METLSYCQLMERCLAAEARVEALETFIRDECYVRDGDDYDYATVKLEQTERAA